MYECPIDIVTLPVATAFDNNVLKVVHQTGINVDHDELIKALRYDRDQYGKGYADGRDALPKWISVEERLPDTWEDVIVYGEKTYGGKTHRGVFNDSLTLDGKFVLCDNVTHWMPLPNAPAEYENDIPF